MDLDVSASVCECDLLCCLMLIRELEREAEMLGVLRNKVACQVNHAWVVP